MEFEIWWIWLFLAGVFLIGEIFTAGFFLLWFSFGAAAAGVLALLGVGTEGQFIVFIVVSGILYVSGRRFADRVTVKQPPGIGADRYVGKEGVVVEEVDNSKNSGSVRIGQELWRATSGSDEILPAGSKVTVVKIDGSRAIVQHEKEEN